PRAVLVEEVVDQLRCRRVEARRLFEVGEARLGDVPGGAESEQERPLAGRADAGDLVERAFHEFLLAPRAMGSDGEAVRFVAQALNEEQGWIAGREPERLAPLDEEGLAPRVAVGAFGDRGESHARNSERGQNLACGLELPFS